MSLLVVNMQLIQMSMNEITSPSVAADEFRTPTPTLPRAQFVPLNSKFGWLIAFIVLVYMSRNEVYSSISLDYLGDSISSTPKMTTEILFLWILPRMVLFLGRCQILFRINAVSLLR